MQLGIFIFFIQYPRRKSGSTVFQSASVVADSSINISSLYFHNHVNDIKQSWALSVNLGS